MFQYPQPQLRAQLIETSLLVGATKVRSTYNVDGTGFTVAVLDTGARTTHVDFAGTGKIPAQKNFTTDNKGNANDAADGQGHGTNVGGIICANGIHVGIAPGAKMIPIKVLSNTGGGTFTAIESGLDWVIANRATYNITCVCMSLGTGTNETSDAAYTNDTIRQKFATLRQARVAVCVAAGNSFGSFSSQEGMGFPAILRECISVGATYDSNAGSFSYSGATAFSTGPKRITPFSQRLHSSTNVNARTDTFAPGAPLTSAGIANDNAESTMHGTSQATPVVAGLVLLAQQYHKSKTGQLPTIDKLESVLRLTTSQIVDGDDEDDSVTNTNKSYFFADAVKMFQGLASDGTPNVPSSSNVTATYNSGTKLLTVTGDKGINRVSIVRSGRYLKVVGGTATQINAKTSEVYDLLDATTVISLVADLKEGADILTVEGVQMLNATIGMGAGADAVTIKNSSSEVMIINADSSVASVAGADSVVVEKSTISKSLTCNLGPLSDKLYLSASTVNKLSLLMGTGSDTATVISNVPDLAVDGGDGIDTLTIAPTTVTIKSKTSVEILLP